MGRKTGINNGSADVKIRHMRYTQSQNELRRIAQADKAAALRLEEHFPRPKFLSRLRHYHRPPQVTQTVRPLHPRSKTRVKLVCIKP